MDLAFSFILMARNMKVSLEMESKKGMGEFYIRMEMYTMENGQMIELMDMEYSKTQQVLGMREIGN